MSIIHVKYVQIFNGIPMDPHTDLHGSYVGAQRAVHGSQSGSYMD